MHDPPSTVEEAVCELKRRQLNYQAIFGKEKKVRTVSKVNEPVPIIKLPHLEEQISKYVFKAFGQICQDESYTLLINFF